MTTASAIQPRKLGRTGPAVFPIALGCMGMSGMYGPADEPESLATIHAAIDAGVTLIDTGDFYGMGHNEMLLSQALRFFREKVLISVKFGAQRGPDGSWLGYDARPAAVKTALAYSLKRLGVDHIDIYRPARLDPNVPIEDTIGAIADMIKAGYVRYIGLSEVGPETIRRAAAVHPIVDLQIEYSLISRSPESKIFPVLDELGIAVTAYGVLSRGLLSGSAISGAGDIRNRFPRFNCREPRRRIRNSLRASLRSPPAKALRNRSSPSPGLSPRVLPSFRSSARAHAPSLPKASPLSRSGSPSTKSRRSKPQFRPMQLPEPATTPTRCRSSIVKNSRNPVLDGDSQRRSFR